MSGPRYRVRTPLLMSGVKHGPGAEVELGAIAARELLACGAVEVIPPPPAPTGGDDNETPPSANGADGASGEGAGVKAPAPALPSSETPRQAESDPLPPSGGGAAPAKSRKGK